MYLIRVAAAFVSQQALSTLRIYVDDFSLQSRGRFLDFVGVLLRAFDWLCQQLAPLHVSFAPGKVAGVASTKQARELLHSGLERRGFRGRLEVKFLGADYAAGAPRARPTQRGRY